MTQYRIVSAIVTVLLLAGWGCGSDEAIGGIAPRGASGESGQGGTHDDDRTDGLAGLDGEDSVGGVAGPTKPIGDTPTSGGDAPNGGGGSETGGGGGFDELNEPQQALSLAIVAGLPTNPKEAAWPAIEQAMSELENQLSDTDDIYAVLDEVLLATLRTNEDFLAFLDLENAAPGYRGAGLRTLGLGSSNTSTVLVVNGVRNSWFDAPAFRDLVQREWGRSAQSAAFKNVHFDYFHNRTGLDLTAPVLCVLLRPFRRTYSACVQITGSTPDFLQSAAQWINQLVNVPVPFSESSALARKIEDKFTTTDALVVMPHSQGNFLTQEALAMLGDADRSCVGVTALASPAPFDQRTGYGAFDPLTLRNDIILLVPGSLPHNLENALSRSLPAEPEISDRILLHGIETSYLKYRESADAIVAKVAAQLTTLSDCRKRTISITLDGTARDAGWIDLTDNGQPRTLSCVTGAGAKICEAEFETEHDIDVTATALPGSGAMFTGWSGPDCAGAGTAPTLTFAKRLNKIECTTTFDCPAGTSWSNTTQRCECDPGTTECGGACLGACVNSRMERNSATCDCACTSAWVACGGGCRAPCGPGLTLNQNGCSCQYTDSASASCSVTWFKESFDSCSNWHPEITISGSYSRSIPILPAPSGYWQTSLVSTSIPSLIIVAGAPMTSVTSNSYSFSGTMVSNRAIGGGGTPPTDFKMYDPRGALVSCSVGIEGGCRE